MKMKANYKFHAAPATMFFHIKMNSSKMCFYTQFQVPILRGASDAPISEVRVSAILFLPIIGN